MDTDALRKIGLTENEIKIYLNLLKTGLSTAYDIGKKTGIYRVHVYDKLEQLMDKGLVTHVYRGAKKYFQATPPTKIKQYLGSVADIYGDTLVPTLNLVYWLEIISGAIKAQDDVAELKWFDLKQVLKDLAFHNVRVAIDLLKAEIHYNEV